MNSNAIERLRQFANSPAARPLRFIAVGGAATCVHLATALLITFVSPKTSAYLANLLAFSLAFSASYFGHRHVTFQRAGSAARFLVVSLAGLILNNVILATCLHFGVVHSVALTVAVALVPILSYLASSLWAFSTAETDVSMDDSKPQA
ncbi:GtrA family protein [Azovibrio sp.]|uniref:GtrA family protein n=1 Tax=Azovibrio sp. TaxID=1872673 RepID=UPI003C736A19